MDGRIRRTVIETHNSVQLENGTSSSIQRLQALFKCHLCGYVSKKKYNVKTHIEVVHYNMKHLCFKSCGKRYSRRPDLRKHLLNKHGFRLGRGDSLPVGW
ncbi:hypothetical protein OH76DRAFT_1408323 [Lentinus brumalis]|uniref:C2H2-type domain-containing protein n=1 Tax=Lentinus brumalis TaxID=2498619 RepID=A0A371CY57_9APHY|nr:hypothetical protein OH76DRAFT_1408323 [Polyporus brumalis]